MKKFIYLATASLFFLLGVTLSYTYRLYIYKNQIFDFHIADTIGNLVAAPAIILFFRSYSKRPLWRDTVYAIIALIIYELSPIGVTDYRDIIATFLSGGISYFVLKNVEGKYSVFRT